MSSSYDLTMRFTATDDRRARRIVAAIERGLNDAGAEVESARVEPVRDPNRLFERAVPMAGESLDGEAEELGA